MGYNNIILNSKKTGDTGNKLTCDYLYISTSDFNMPTIENVPTWEDNNALLIADFNDESLVAGNSEIRGNINGYQLRRKKSGDLHTTYVTTITENTKSRVIDYMTTNNSGYTYYLYPILTTDTKKDAVSPLVSDEVFTDWDYWSLLVVDETEEENVFHLNKMFKFELNFESEDMSNNAIISVTPNFTPYPTVQYAPSNYWSGGLSSLCGYVSTIDCEYVQTPNMIKELKSLTSDTRRKFLKDIEGNIFEVKITAPISLHNEDNIREQPKTLKLQWTEVGSTDGISIVNNPDTEMVSWLLTETGEAVSYVSYIWDEHYRWDNSYYWTSKDDVLETSADSLYLGQSVSDDGGDVN